MNRGPYIYVISAKVLAANLKITAAKTRRKKFYFNRSSAESFYVIELNFFFLFFFAKD